MSVCSLSFSALFTQPSISFSTRDVPLIREGRPLTSVSGLNLASVSQSLMAEGASDTGVEVNRLLSVGPNLRPALVLPPVNDADAADMGTKLLVVLDEGSPMIKYSGLDVSGNDVVVAIEENRELSVETNDCSSGKPPSAQDADKICPSVGGNGDYSVDDVVSPSNGAVDDLSDSAVLVMNAPTLDSSQRQNSGTLIGSGPPLATHKAAIRQVEVKAVSDLFGPSVPIDGFAARLAARAVPNQDAASLFGGLDAGSRDPFAAAAVEMKPLLKAQRRQQVDGDLFGAPYARLTEQLSIHPAVTEPPKPVPRNTSAELFGSTPPAAALADVFCSPASSVSDAGSLFGSGPPSHDVPQTEDKGSEHVYEITGMVVASVGSVTGSYPVNEHSKLAAVLSGSSAPVPTMNRATTVATTTSSPVSDSLPQPAAPVRASSGGARKTLLAVRTATDLFGPSADSFASTSVDASFGTAQSSIGNDLFGGVPVSSADAFSAPAPGVCNSLPVRGAAAGDVFSRAAPITAESSADPFSPPSAPGVKKGVTAAPYSSQGPRRSPCVGSQVGPAPVVISANGVPLPASVSLVEVAPVSSTQKGKPKVDGQRPRFPGSSGAATLPPGMIPTPHGFVPAVTLGGPIVVRSGGCTPPACASASGPAGGAASKGHLYRFPQPCAFISFGFGGKVIANTPPAQYPSGFGGQLSHQRTSPFSLKMYRLIDLIDAYCAVKKKGELWDGAEPELQRAEVKRLVELMKCFDGPLQFSQAESEIQSFIDGCLSSLSEEPLSTNMNDTNVHDKKGVESSERLLWGVLRILIDNNGMAQSESGCADPSSPESRLSALLLQSAPQRLFAAAGVPSEQTSGKEVFQPPTPGLSQSTLVEIENMLVAGNREEALHRALELNEFPLAILIGTVCGKDAFQHAVRSYADNRFSVESSLHFLSMIYSNQGAAALKVPVKLNTVSDIQSTAPLPIGNSHAVVKSWKDCSPHVKDWRRRLATILANKSGDWVDICRTLGERVYSETNDIAAAHVAYIVSGSLPSATAGKGKYSLLGCDGNSPYFRNVTDLHSILGLRRAEIIEWAVLRGTKRSQQLKSSSYESSGGLSLSNLFGLKANNPTRGTSSKLSGPTDTVSPERALRLRVAMCYPKLKFALWLADLGLTDSAAAYVVEAREIVRMCRITTPPTPKQVPRGKTEEPPSPMRGDSTPTFSKGFTRALDEFCDRLSGGGSLASSSIGKQALGGCDSAGGLWKGLGASISSALSSSNLKDFVDGPEPSSPPVVLDCGPRMQTHPPLQRSGPPMDTSREIIASMSQSQNSNLFSSNPIGGFPPSSRSTSHTTHEGGNMERTGSVPGDMLSYTAHADRRVVPLAPSSGSGSTGSEKKNPPRKDVEEDSGSGVVTKVSYFA